MRFRQKSSNYDLLRNLISKTRNYTLPDEINYIVIYTFLYKYCSDSLKDHFLLTLQDKEMTLDEAYNDEFTMEMLREDAYRLYGFHIENPNAFIDELINNQYSDRFFLSQFFSIFPKSISFDKNTKEKEYFEFLFKTITQEIQINRYSHESEMYLAIKEIVYSISKLDIFESEFPFNEVFEILSSSRLMGIRSEDYVFQIMTSLISCEKKPISRAYDPFLNDASSLISLSQICRADATYYGKESDKLTYCYAIARFFINLFNLEYVEFRNEDAKESVDIDGSSFDAIISRIPVNIRNYYSSNEKQNFEIAKRNKRSELEEMLLSQFNMDSESFAQDSELNSALENLLEKMDVEDDSSIEFKGEYESLKDNEFLFIINLIDSLADDGVMAISISQNFLFKNSLQILRRYLVLEKNYIDAIISLPEGLSRRRPETVIVFKKNRISRDILFIDLSKNYTTQKKEILFPGLFRRNLILSQETIDGLADIYHNKKSIDKISKLTTINEIRNKNFNLSVSRYVDTFEGEFIKLSDLKNEKKEIDENIQDLNLKIEKMMEDLNIRFK